MKCEVKHNGDREQGFYGWGINKWGIYDYYGCGHHGLKLWAVMAKQVTIFREYAHNIGLHDQVRYYTLSDHHMTTDFSSVKLLSLYMLQQSVLL